MRFIIVIILVVSGNFVLFLDSLVKIAFGAVGNIDAVRLDFASGNRKVY